MTQKMTGARFLAEMLKGYGLTHVFFMPHIMPAAMNEFDKVGIKHIMAHSEKGAAYMADGYARTAKRPAVVMCQSVGALNLAAGLQDAYLGCSPVIAITGRQTEANLHRHAYQEVDHVDPFDAVTKFNAAVTDLENFPRYLRHAFRAVTTGTPGPAHIDIVSSGGDQMGNIQAELEVRVEEQFTRLPAFRSTPEVSHVREALRLIREAKRPVIVAGGGVVSSGASLELVELAERLSIPVATSLNAKETIPGFHPLNVGCCGMYSRSCANRTVANADLVFFAGSHTGGQVTNYWKIPRQGTSVIQLDINPVELGRSFPITVGMQGDIKSTLRMMLDESGKSSGSSCQEWIMEVHTYVEEWKEAVAPNAQSDAVPIRPERLCNELADALPENAVLVSDTGHSGIWTSTMIDLKHKSQSYIRCAGSLGWGVPAAIGAKCAAPERPVVCFTGDGGMWYHHTELDAARRHGINTVTVVNNNRGLNQEKIGVERAFGGRSEKSDSLWLLSETNFAKVAESIGCLGIRVTKPGDIPSAMEQALRADRPVIVDVVTDVEGIAPKTWA